MKPYHLPLMNNQEQYEQSYMLNKEKLLKKSSTRKKLHFTHKVHDYPRNQSFSSSSLATSNAKITSINQQDTNQTRLHDYSSLSIIHFTEKYLPRGAPLEQIYDQMCMVIDRKQSQIQALRVYRDELKFISFNNPYFTPIRISLRALKDKASTESSLHSQKKQLNQEVKEMILETDLIEEYTEFINEQISINLGKNQIIDIDKEETLMIENLQLATEHLIKALAESKKKYAQEVKSIQEQILDLRVQIKQKQNQLRDLKAKICTMYIKLHSRNSSSSKGHCRNMSMSIRKFNNQSNHSMKEIYIGNNSFKGYSRQILEKISPEQQMVKIKFFANKTNLTFQCIYKSNSGIIHLLKKQAHNYSLQNQNILSPDSHDQIHEKVSSEQNLKLIEALSFLQEQEIYVKYLFSMKFFYKAKIVGVQCRMKTHKGNKHVRIGNCDPHIEHELVTLVNKKLITLGSYWYKKQMMGISLWYSDKMEVGKEMKNSYKRVNGRSKQTKQAYQQYYT